MLNSKSRGIIDDLLVYYMGNNKYMLVVNASNMGKDFLWLNENNDSAVDIKNHSENISLFAVQGPNAEKVCNKLFEKKIEYMNNYLHNSIVEIEELNDYTEKKLLNNHKFVDCKLKEYKSMENTINNYVTHNL